MAYIGHRVDYMKKYVFGILISGIAIFFLAKNFDIREFERLKGNLNWWIFPLLVLSNLWAFVPFSFRWMYLLESKIKFSQSFTTSIIGVGLNMILPARGGDLVRLLMNKKDTEIPLTQLLSRIFLEKVMDLIAVVLFGASALFFLGLTASENWSLLYISTFVIFAMVVGLFLVKYALPWLQKVLGESFRLIGKESLYKNHFEGHLIDFSQFLTLSKLRIPILYSLPTWIFGYAISYYLAGQFMGMPLSFTEAVLCMFLGGMGVAIPSAPSGIGVFHAAIVSGFLILGREPGEGLVYATVVHLSQFLILISLSLVAYGYWKWEEKQKESGLSS